VDISSSLAGTGTCVTFLILRGFASKDDEESAETEAEEELLSILPSPELELALKDSDLGSTARLLLGRGWYSTSSDELDSEKLLSFSRLARFLSITIGS